MQAPHAAGYTVEVTKGFAGTSGNELEAVLAGQDIILHDITIFIPDSTEATTYKAGIASAGSDIIADVYYASSSIATFFNYAGKGKLITLAAAKKIFLNISISKDFKVNIHYSYKP